MNKEKPKQNNYNYMKMLCSNLTRNQLIEDLTIKCEELYLTRKKYEKLEIENIRLNNIINKLEKWLKEEHENGYEVYYLMAIQDTLDKLKELKEDK